MKYAASTKVPVAKSQGDILKTLKGYGAASHRITINHGQRSAQVEFFMRRRIVRIEITTPHIDEDRFVFNAGFSRVMASVQRERFERECRRIWRALLLCIKAKLEAVASGISTFDAEFMAHVVMPADESTTVGSLILPQIERAYKQPQSRGQLLLIEDHRGEAKPAAL